VREGLVAVRHRDLGDFHANIVEREWESELARGWATRAAGPLLVAGDFNMPVESAIYRRYWSGFENAFSTAGNGYGSTKHTRLFGTRIDHVLAAPGLECVNAFVGPDAGSDHRPLVADYRVRAGGSR
jgi:vancomycin resistance protein VanJ